MQAADPDLPDIVALQEGDETALDRLMARHKDALFGFICARLKDPEDAREVVVDTFVRVYRKRHQFRPSGRFNSWLYRIALNLCRDRARTWRRLPFVSRGRASAMISGYDAGDLPDERPDPLAVVSSQESTAALEALIDELPERLREALVLHLVEQRPQAECAELLAVTVKTIETRVYRARRLLKARLQGRTRETTALPWSRPAMAR